MEGWCKSAKHGLAIGVKIGGNGEKSGKKTHLLVIIHVRIPQKLVCTTLTDLIKKKEKEINKEQKVFNINAEFI